MEKVNNGPEGERVHIHGESGWKKSVKNLAPKLSSSYTAAIRKHIKVRVFPAFVVAMADPKAVLEVFRAVEEEGLDLHVAVFAEDRAVVQASGVVKARQVSGSKNYIGLRESPEDALQRGQQVYKGIESVEKQMVVLRIRFTNAGLGHFTKKCSGADHAIDYVLKKKVFPHDPTDWKGWHFNEDLPLFFQGPTGVTLITSELLEDVFMNVEAM